MFIIYINDIKDDLESEILIFADDTTLIATGLNEDVTSAQITRDLIKIELWAQKWKVTFNGDKSKEMIKKKNSQQNSPEITFCNHIVENVSVHRHLGVYITPTLN